MASGGGGENKPGHAQASRKRAYSSLLGSLRITFFSDSYVKKQFGDGRTPSLARYLSSSATHEILAEPFHASRHHLMSSRVRVWRFLPLRQPCLTSWR